MLFFASCKGNNSSQKDTLLYKDVVIANNCLDTCLFIIDKAGDTITFIRDFEIIENTFTDTMNVAFNMVRPLETGKYFHCQRDTVTNAAMYNSPEHIEYLESIKSPELYTNFLCLYNLTRRRNGFCTGKGMMTLRVYYKQKK